MTKPIMGNKTPITVSQARMWLAEHGEFQRSNLDSSVVLFEKVVARDGYSQAIISHAQNIAEAEALWKLHDRFWSIEIDQAKTATEFITAVHARLSWLNHDLIIPAAARGTGGSANLMSQLVTDAELRAAGIYYTRVNQWMMVHFRDIVDDAV